jgi:hypothetical protein
MARHGKARHRVPGPHDTTQVVVRTIELVDHTGTAHLVTLDAAAEGLSRGRYTTIC